MTENEKYIEALIDLHRGLERQGPGDKQVSMDIIQQLSGLPTKPRIADIGCGAGAGTLLLARIFQSNIKAVDFSAVFLAQLMESARKEGLEPFIEPVECDMGELDWAQGSIDLLWSEGAAYSIGFERALKTWRPFMAMHGIAVISEMSYFTDEVSGTVSQYMQNVYPAIKTEAQNIDLIQACGFEVLDSIRLPTQAWWDNYYNPLREKMRGLKDSTDPVLQAVMKDTEEEMQFFETHAAEYGYTFYIMKAV